MIYRKILSWWHCVCCWGSTIYYYFLKWSLAFGVTHMNCESANWFPTLAIWFILYLTRFHLSINNVALFSPPVSRHCHCSVSLWQVGHLPKDWGEKDFFFLSYSSIRWSFRAQYFKESIQYSLEEYFSPVRVWPTIGPQNVGREMTFIFDWGCEY